MNKIYLIFLVLFFNCVQSQEKKYTILVKDIETQLPIENATVVILKTNQILQSNKEGKVEFMLNGFSSIDVSNNEYIRDNIRWNELKTKDFVIYLKSKTNKLDDVVITKEDPLKTLQKLIASSSKKLTIPVLLKVYVREFFKLNDKYSYYNDGLVNFQLTEEKKKINTTLLVEQNRSYGLVDEDVSADLLGYNLNSIMESYYSYRYLKPILENEESKKYDFGIKVVKNDDNFYVMTITPKDNVKEALNEYEIVYEPTQRIIKEYAVKLIFKNGIVKEEKVGNGVKNTTKSVVKVSYRFEPEGYYLLNAYEAIGYDLTTKGVKKSIDVDNTFVTTYFNEKPFTYTDQNVFKDKTLFNKMNSILTSYWDLSGLLATEQEKAIIKSLEYKL